MINKLFYYLNKNRNDITWIKGDSPENCNWDKTLPNQQEIIDLLQNYNESQVVIVPFSVKPRQLKTAIVLKAERVEGADRLLKLQIEVGNETRQIVAGIAEHYSTEELIGKMIVIVANLEPATIRGIESNGMLLAAKKGKELSLVMIDSSKVQSGMRIF